MIRNTCVNSIQSLWWCRPLDHYAAQDWKSFTLQNVVFVKYPPKNSLKEAKNFQISFSSIDAEDEDFYFL